MLLAMSGDEIRGSQRAAGRPRVPPGPLADLKALLYELYLAAGTPRLDDIAARVREDGDLAGSPLRDTISRVIGDAVLPGSQADVVAVATVLARVARWDPADAAARARDLWVAARMTVPAWVPLAEVTDPFALEVHRPVQLDDAPAGLSVLPPYVPREHDARLAAVVRASAGGRSGIAVLVGGSSAGKTRACWEALGLLRGATGQWRLWHPPDPGRTEPLLAGVGPRTVVWLNEAQEYLGGPDGELVAAGLRGVLGDAARAPVLVLATLWPEEHDALTRDHGSQAPRWRGGEMPGRGGAGSPGRRRLRRGGAGAAGPGRTWRSGPGAAAVPGRSRHRRGRWPRRSACR